MKNSITLILSALFLCTSASAQTTDTAATKKVCIAESQAVVDYDYDTYASYHVQRADEQLTYNNPDGTFGTYSGNAGLYYRVLGSGKY